ncbi:NUDIX domain-containing protein [Actinoplanes sp. NPDC026623]|uniref:NUDIX hydrolase n=1 Tax=Actinoplanes sp. NPDC026623 TaxID=3155610 RepID=UPI0033D1D8DB
MRGWFGADGAWSIGQRSDALPKPRLALFVSSGLWRGKRDPSRSLIDGKVVVVSISEVTAATWACIRHRRLLVVRPHGQDVFFLPGGVPEPDETLEEAATREVAEEVGIELRPDDLTLFAEIVTAAYGRPGTDVRLVCFTGESDAVPAPKDEIAEVAWFSAVDADRCAPAIQQLITRLVQAGLVLGQR